MANIARTELEQIAEDGTEQEFANQVGQGFTEYADVNETRAAWETFEQDGLLTNNAGVVIKIGTAEFEVRVIRR